MSEQIDTNSIVIFTDGSSRGNPGPGGWGSIIVIHDDLRADADTTRTDVESARVIELGGSERETTNNRMELTAVIKALHYIERSEPELPTTNYQLLIYTDSTYLINGATKWLPAWIENRWRTKSKQAVANQDLWQMIHELLERYAVRFEYVGGHVGIGGNERADQIATAFADNREITLENTTLDQYPVDLSTFTPDETAVRRKASASSRGRRGRAYSYVSLVNGVVETHTSWEECKARVHGKNARYRKAMSKEHEREIVDEFSRDLS